MSPWNEDAKKLSSGLADKYTLAITEARFAFPYENAAEACALVLKGERNIDGELDDGHIWLGVGAFEPGDKEGTFAIHESQNAEKKPSKNSKWGRFLASAFEVGVPLEEHQDPSRNQYEIRDALMWEGLVVEIEEIEEEGTFKKGPDAGKAWSTRTPLIRAYLGKVGEGASGAGATEASVSAPAAANNGAVNPADFDTHMGYLENFVAAGGDPGDPKAQKAFWEAARS